MTHMAGGTRAAVLRRPLVGLSCFFIAGTWCGLRWEAATGFLLILSALLVLASVVFRRHVVSSVIVYFGVLTACWAWAQLSIHTPSPCRLSSLAPMESECVALTGVVTTDPTSVAGGGVGAKSSWTFDVKVEGLRRLAPWQRVRGTVRVNTRLPANRLVRYGDRWLLEGQLQRRSYGRSGRRARYRLRAIPDTERLISSGHGNPLIAKCFQGRKACAETLETGMADFPEPIGLLKALLLGYRRELPFALRESFATTGTLHIFAISGLHVGVMVILLMAILRTVGMPRPYWVFALAPALVLYTMATGLKASAVRACIMALVYGSAAWVGRKPDGPSSLALAAMLILGWVPSQLMSPGFQLSFIVVAGIIVMYPPLIARMAVPWQKDPWRLEKEPFRVRLFRRNRLRGVSLSHVQACLPFSWQGVRNSTAD